MKRIEDFVGKIIQGDCLSVMKDIPNNSVDAIVTDPPYGLGFMNKEWDILDKSQFGIKGNEGKNDLKIKKNFNVLPRFNNKGLQQFCFEWATECLRVLKPGSFLLSFGGCYDNKTEILTNEGWKFFKDVKDSDKVSTLNPKNSLIEYQKPIERVVYNNYKKLYHFKTNKIDLLVTPNHKIFTKYMGGYKNAKWKLIEADKAKNAIKMKKNGIWDKSDVKDFILPTTKQSNGHFVYEISDKKIPMDIWLKFFGLWIAEGSSTIGKVRKGQGYNTQICHFNNNNLDELEKELSKYFNICRYKKSGKFRINNKQLASYLQQFGYSWQKFIPKEIKQLSSKQLKILLEWYMKGDGDKRNRAYTCSKKLVDDLQEIALKIGISADYYIEKKCKSFIKGREIKQKHIQYRVVFNKKQNEPEVYQRKDKRTIVKSIESYKGDVYCIEVPKYHILYVRRNGKTCWCGNTRTYHRMVCGIEDTGFEIRDCIMWIYGSGFPKSLNVGKQIDKIQKNKREVVEIKQHAKKDFKDNLYAQDPANKNNKKVFGYGEEEITKGNSEWEGWGTALKPACEPIVVARKPLSEKNVALNVLKWGVGGINIDGCIVKTDEVIFNQSRGCESAISKGKYGNSSAQKTHQTERQKQGRFPANIILDEEAGKMLDKQSGESLSKGGQSYSKTSNIYGKYANDRTIKDCGFADKGGASRFFYCAKASKSERGENNFHPTVKPLKLMQYLIRLVSTENAIILDPFVGSGTTAISCIKEHRKYIGIDKDVNIARERLNNTEKPLDSHF